jgi:hypothetical protein
MAESELPLPVEIPWRLAATTQPLVAGHPEETAISLFVFEPDDEALADLFPDERLVYLKFTVTVSPAAIPNAPPVAALGEGVPCLFLRLDVKIRNREGELGTIRPYFHAASPVHRTMVQTGIVGADAFEGESDELSIGRSGSQMHESSSNRTRTTSAGLNAGFGIGGFSIGGSVRTTSTDVTGSRSVTQQVDTTQRQASEERRELLSHMTRVENVLTLLDAKYVGTPHLRFSLSPRPLQLLSLDPTDPNLWFSQLLARRSSGIEGVQEFAAVALVPRNEGFCVNARLRRVCLLDTPPGPLTFDEPFQFNQHLGRVLGYLGRAYPPGTPLDELDVDLISPLDPQAFARPIVEQWVVSATGYVLAGVASHKPGAIPPGQTSGFNLERALVGYKHLRELWLETQRDEYEREVARSPVERGILLGEHRTLDTCFAAGDGGFAVSGSTTSVTPLARVVVDPGEIDLGGVQAAASRPRTSTRERAYETATRWNLLDQRLAVLLANDREERSREFDLGDADVLALVVDRWRRLRAEDPRNLPLDRAAAALGLGAAARRALKSAGATDLRTLAEILASSAGLEAHGADLARFSRAFKTRGTRSALPDAVQPPLAAAEVVEIRRTIAVSLTTTHRRGAGRKGR